MILDAFATLLDRTPPAFVRKIEASVLLDLFAKAFDVKAPALEDVSADAALATYREFSAACMEAALADPATAQQYRTRLRAHALELGEKVRAVLGVRSSQAMRVASFFYRGIGIELSGSLPGKLRFGPCSFSSRYTPGCCWLMSGFDEGFLCGLSGYPRAELGFECRLTEGAPCCWANLAQN